MTTATASAPTRASNSFTLVWGGVPIPVSLYTGTESTRVVRKEFLPVGDALVAVGRSPVRKDTGEVIDSSVVVRYAEASNGELVSLTDEEIANCTIAKGEGHIVAFVPTKNLDQYLAEDQAQIRPKVTKGKSTPSVDRSFALLLTIMKRLKVAALVKVALRGPARYGLLDSEGTFTLVYTADAVREARPLDTEYKFTAQEIALAATIVTEVVGVDTPVLTDETAPAVQAYVDSKASGVTTTVVENTNTPPVDIMAAMIETIEAAKKAKAAKKGKGAA